MKNSCVPSVASVSFVAERVGINGNYMLEKRIILYYYTLL